MTASAPDDASMGGAREKLMLNAHPGSEAFEAFSHLIGIPAGKLRTFARDPDVDAIIKQAGG
jgi:hypothetical protein